MKGFTIHHALDIVDGMISPVSTTVLDCIYLAKPAAVFTEQTPLFSHLPQIAGIEDVENFIATLGDSAKMVDEPLLRQFGNLEANLAHAAEAVENFMLHELSRTS